MLKLVLAAILLLSAVVFCNAEVVEERRPTAVAETRDDAARRRLEHEAQWYFEYCRALVQEAEDKGGLNKGFSEPCGSSAPDGTGT